MTESYESVLEVVARAEGAAQADVRDVTWITPASVVGVARDDEGRIELFLAGEALDPASPAVRESLEFRSWHRLDAQPFEASRLRFPPLGYYDQVAAFVCTELLRAGADVSLRTAFREVEPIIELAIEQQRSAQASIVGLAGEMLLLDALCRHATDLEVGQVIEAWDGWQRSTRDFVWGTTGVEVKTTTRSTSSHLVEGVHQVEPGDASEGSPESRLLLISIGLQHAPASGGDAFTIPELLDRILGRTKVANVPESVIDRFLAHVSEYGAGSSTSGYRHGQGEPDLTYRMPFVTGFFRAYDMTDPAIKVIRREDVIERHHVDPSSLRFRIDLPSTASFGNPVVGANQVAREILAAGHSTPPRPA